MSKKSTTPFIDQFGEDLTKMAAEGKLDPIIGRDNITGPVNGYAVRMGRNTAMNPVLEASSLANYTWTRTVASQMGSAYGELNLLKGLVFKTTISASNQHAKQDEYRGTYSKSVNLGFLQAFSNSSGL